MQSVPSEGAVLFHYTPDQFERQSGSFAPTLSFRSRFVLVLCSLLLLIAGPAFILATVAGESATHQIQVYPLGQGPTARALSTQIKPSDIPSGAPVGPLLNLGQSIHSRLSQNQARFNPPSSPQALAKQHQAITGLRQRAGQDVEVRLRPQAGTPLMIKGASLHPRFSGIAKASADIDELTARAFLRANSDLLRIEDPDTEFLLRKKDQDQLGLTHLRFAQVYQTLPVWPCELIVHLNRAGEVYLLDGTFVPTPSTVGVKPAISAREAIDRAHRSLGAKAKATLSPAELILCGPLDSAPRLSWKFDLTLGPAHAWRLVIDAQTGAVLSQSSLVHHEAAQGSGVDSDGITRPLNLWREGGKYYLTDTSKPFFDPASSPLANSRGVIEIQDLRQGLAEGQFQAYYVTSQNPSSGWDPDAVSAAFGLSQAYDYYSGRHGRNSLDGVGGTVLPNIIGVIHSGTNVANAFWNPTYKMLFFGDLVPRHVDTSGHEFTHAIIDHSGDGGVLEYKGQSGALNEAFADIFGEMIEALALGTNDWIASKGFPQVGDLRDFINPSRLQQNGRPFPSRMSQFIDLGADDDLGGVHFNSSIINHAFYLLAEGLTGAIGIRDAERIFYRALTLHLQKQSQFVDMRLACVNSAGELFGPISSQARKTIEAFDAIELFDAPSTPPPPTIPTVQAPDSTLYLTLEEVDPVFGALYNLTRRETALNDGDSGRVLFTQKYLAYSRPAVTGDGSLALFVTLDHDLGFISTDGDASSLFLANLAGRVASVAIAPNGSRSAFVARDAASGEPLNEIWVNEIPSQNLRMIKLVATGTEGSSLDTVQYASSMTFTPDGRTIVYDALTSLRTEDRRTVDSWTIYSLNLDTDQITTLITAKPGADIGNPNLSHTRSHLLTYEIRDKTTRRSTVLTTDLRTGQTAEIATVTVDDATGVPCYSGDDTAIIYAQGDDSTVIGYSLMRQQLAPDGITPVGAPTLWIKDGDMPVIYRRGTYIGTNGPPVIQLVGPSTNQPLPAPATFSIEATASDPDGQIAKVEFYDGSTRLAEATAPPYRLTLTNITDRTFRFVARATDNLGAAQDSLPLNVIVDAPPATNTNTTVFSTSFEASEGYDQTKTLADQNGWLGGGTGGNGIVTNFLANQPQSAYIGFTRSTNTGSSFVLGRPVNFAPLEQQLPKVSFSAQMAIYASTTTNQDWFNWTVFNTDSKRLFDLNFSTGPGNRTIFYRLSTGDYQSTGFGISNGVTYQLTINMDFAANLWTAHIGPTTIVTNQPITTTNHALTLREVDAQWIFRDPANPGTDYMVFDDYRITAQPSSSGGTNLGPALLSIRSANTNLFLSWPVSPQGYALQSADRLSPSTSWTDVTMVPVLTGADNVVAVPTPPSTTFFRLIKR